MAGANSQAIGDNQRADIADRMAAVAKELLGDPPHIRNGGKELRYGSRGSMVIDVTRGIFFDHEAGVGGGVLDFIAHVTKSNRPAAIQWLSQTFPGSTAPVGFDRFDRFDRMRGAVVSGKDQSLKRVALDVWHEAGGASDTLVERYLGSRNVRFGAKLQDIRFHANCVFGRDEATGILVRHPCMVALVRDAGSGDPIGIHRTALTADGRKIDRKMLGPTRGGVVMLSRGEIEGGLAVAEGIETALSAAKLFARPVWAVLSAGAMRGFSPLEGVGALTIYADGDEAGHSAAVECGLTWRADGVNVECLAPEQDGWDWNDVLVDQEQRVTG